MGKTITYGTTQFLNTQYLKSLRAASAKLVDVDGMELLFDGTFAVTLGFRLSSVKLQDWI